MKTLDRRHWLLLAMIVALLLIAFVSPYRYEHMGDALVRINRFSGQADALGPRGWKPLRPSTAADVKEKYGLE